MHYRYFIYMLENCVQRRRGNQYRGKGPQLSPRWKSTDPGKRTWLKDTVYRVSITTGNQKNNGTSARVYLRMKGSKGKMTKKCLSKSKAAVKSKTANENKKSKTKPFKFTPGSTQTFKIKTADIGDIKSVTLEVSWDQQIIL